MENAKKIYRQHRKIYTGNIDNESYIYIGTAWYIYILNMWITNVCSMCNMHMNINNIYTEKALMHVKFIILDITILQGIQIIPDFFIIISTLVLSLNLGLVVYWQYII